MNPFATLANPPKCRPGDVLEPPPVNRRRRIGRTANDDRFPEVLNPWNLSNTQCEIMRRLTLGQTYREISNELEIAFSTLEIHIAEPRDLLGVKRSILAVLIWDRHFNRKTKASPAAHSADQGD